MNKKLNSKDMHYLKFAVTISENTGQYLSKMGAVYVCGNSVIGSWNTKPTVVWSNETDIVRHAPLGALMSARKNLKNSTMYLTHKPCLSCLEDMVNHGVTRIVFLEDFKHRTPDGFWKYATDNNVELVRVAWEEIGGVTHG